ncbi:MAG: hypothetical protein JW834_02040 [Candidatus Diapherotrites archaeon]|nr:hypothetical protein [Candidatus Diapherotrites archaeon]
MNSAKILCVLVMLSVASAITFVAKTGDNEQIFVTESYAATIKAEAGTVTIDNIAELMLFPNTLANEKTVTPSKPSINEPNIGENFKEFTISYPESFGGQLYVTAKTTLTEQYVEQEVTLENSDDRETVTATLDFTPVSRGTFYVFAPYHKNPNAKYITLSPAENEMRGNNLVIAFDKYLPSYAQPMEVNIKPNLVRVVTFTLKLGPKQKETLKLRYLPGYVADEEKLKESPYSPLVSKQYILHPDEDPLFRISNEDALTTEMPSGVSGTGKELLDAIMSKVNGYADTPTSEDTLSSLDIDFSQVMDRKDSGMTSLEKSLVFREMSRASGIPAEVFIGEKNGKYYAWSVAYAGATSVLFDSVNNKRNYNQIYAEPEPQLCRSTDMHSCPWSGGVQENVVCIFNFCLSAYIILALIILAFVSGFVAIQLKPDLLYAVIGEKKTVGLSKEDRIEGSYTILKENLESTNPLIKSVWDELRRRNGVFNTQDFAAATGFSDILVRSAIEELAEKGFAKKY